MKTLIHHPRLTCYRPKPMQRFSGNQPHETPTPPAEENESGDRTKWKRQTVLSQWYETLQKCVLMVVPALHAAEHIPMSEKLEKFKSSVISPLAHPALTVEFLLPHAIFMEAVLFTILTRRRGTLSHEIGHAIGHWRLEQNLPTEQDDRTEASGVDSLWYFGLNYDLMFGLSGPLTRKHLNYISSLDSAIIIAKHKGILYSEECLPLRQKAKAYYRDLAVMILAGPKMEEYHMGRKAPWSDSSDRSKFRQVLNILAVLEKPSYQWNLDEYHAFIKKETAQIEAETTALLESLDYDRVAQIIEAFLEEVKHGKTVWTGIEVLRKFAPLNQNNEPAEGSSRPVSSDR